MIQGAVVAIQGALCEIVRPPMALTCKGSSQMHTNCWEVTRQKLHHKHDLIFKACGSSGDGCGIRQPWNEKHNVQILYFNKQQFS